MSDPAATPVAVLVICTGNICRSPMAEAFINQRAGEAGIGISATSAGFLLDGEPAAADTVAAMEELGIDLSRHRSRRVTPEMVTAADLVITMERTHARSLALEVPGSAEKIHTIGAAVAGLASPADEPIRDRITRLGRERPAEVLLGRGTDEVEDPYGRPSRFHRRTAQHLDRLTSELVEVLGG